MSSDAGCVVGPPSPRNRWQDKGLLNCVPIFEQRFDITTLYQERAIPTPSKSRSRKDWWAILALFSPGLLLALLLGIPPSREATIEFVSKNWGNLASIWGLGVSIYVYFVAQGAREAAEEARSAERLRTALVGLEGAAAKCIEVGQFAGNQKWDVVELRAQEVLACCRTTVAAWGENPALKESRNKLNEVAALMRSITEEARNANVNHRTILKAQLDSHEKLSVVVGKIQKEHISGRV